MPQEPLNDYLRSLLSKTYARRVGPLELLGIMDVIHVGLRAHEKRLVAAALDTGASWEEIGQALGMARSNAHRRHRDVAAERRGEE